MPRPVKPRRVEILPGARYFKPAGIPMRELEEVRLSVEEAESLRLKDIEKLEQERCAERMEISRATFQRVLSSAREKVAGALLYGKAIRIEGGQFEMAEKRYTCKYGHEWSVPFQPDEDTEKSICPECENDPIDKTAGVE